MVQEIEESNNNNFIIIINVSTFWTCTDKIISDK